MIPSTAAQTSAPGVKPRGQATVEFALVFIILCGLLYGILEVSRLVFISSEINNAAREAAQYASLHATDATVVADATARAKSKLVLADPNSTQVSIPTFSPCTFCPVTVTVTYSWTSAVNVIPDVQHFRLTPLGPINLSTTATKLIENGSP